MIASPDPVALSVIGAALTGIAEEMGVTLVRAAYSPNIKERRDCSAAIFDADARMVAQAEHIPVHLGALPEAVAAVIAQDPAPGDVYLLNDPFTGGTHLPDLTMVSPIHADDVLVGYSVSRAHHSDVGGIAPGSMPADSREVYQEGLVIPPVALVRGGEVVEDMLDLILANVRTPSTRRGDLRAQMAANVVGRDRVLQLATRYGRGYLHDLIDALLDYSQARAAATIRELLPGTYRASGRVEGDGITDDDLTVAASVTIADGHLDVDFTGTSTVTAGNINCPLPVTRSACFFALRTLLADDIPTTGGLSRVLNVTAPEGTLVNARRPAAVCAGNSETSQQIADVVLSALAQVAPLPAPGQGTNNNLVIGGSDWTYYETVAGGQGAHPGGNGPSGVHVGMTNTHNTPVEAIELEYPLQVTRYELRYGSGGSGRYHGGDGVIRELQVQAPATLSVISDRRRRGPAGLAGGGDGAAGVNRLNGDELPAKASRRLDVGDVVSMETPGGAGFGAAHGPKVGEQ
ncbi:MAG: hydantoinase B/oxoprolinase family protein [Pseudonocardiaceae bacterium]|nr:hydantoinase B/oxoprolinase family protein [Pseudonocardiaceae bacterium]